MMLFVLGLFFGIMIIWLLEVCVLFINDSCWLFLGNEDLVYDEFKVCKYFNILFMYELRVE